jgi:hypothetical protein
MSDASVAEYRRKAEECRLRAERSLRDDDKAAWLGMAAEWQRLAESTEASEKRRRANPDAE